jgi:hypothetical protein
MSFIQIALLFFILVVLNVLIWLVFLPGLTLDIDIGSPAAALIGSGREFTQILTKAGVAAGVMTAAAETLVRFTRWARGIERGAH